MEELKNNHIFMEHFLKHDLDWCFQNYPNNVNDIVHLVARY